MKHVTKKRTNSHQDYHGSTNLEQEAVVYRHAQYTRHNDISDGREEVERREKIEKNFRDCKSSSAGVAAVDPSLREDHLSMVKKGRTSRAMACRPEASQAADRRPEQAIAKCKLASDQAESLRKVALPLLGLFVR